MGKITNILFIVMYSFLILACTNPNGSTSTPSAAPPPPPTAPKKIYDVYAAGYYEHQPDGISTACIWKNGVKTDLEVPANVDDSQAYGICFYGGKTYSVGTYKPNSGTNKTCLWIDTSRLDLETSVIGNPTSVFVDNSGIYVAGQVHNGSRYDACFWKIVGAAVSRIKLENSTVNDSSAYSILAQNGTVTIVGDTVSGGTSWSYDGTTVHTQLVSGFSTITQVCLYQGTWYYGGMTNTSSLPAYWKGGVIELNDQPGALWALAVDDSGVSSVVSSTGSFYFTQSGQKVLFSNKSLCSAVIIDSTPFAVANTTGISEYWTGNEWRNLTGTKAYPYAMAVSVYYQ